MITIKHPRRDTKKFSEIDISETFIIPVGSSGVYLKTGENSFHNCMCYNTGDTFGFQPDQEVILVDLVIEYSIRT